MKNYFLTPVLLTMATLVSCKDKNEPVKYDHFNKNDSEANIDMWGNLRGDKDINEKIDIWGPSANENTSDNHEYENIFNNEITGKHIFPKQTIKERVHYINNTVKEVLGEQEKYIVLVDSSVDPLTVIGELQMTNPKFIDLLRYTCGNTGIRIKICNDNIYLSR